MKIVNNKPIAILMATYNGEKFLAEQIDSILSQTNSDWTLYIQDDGSLDDTRKIIDEYCSSHDNIQVVDLGLTRQGACVNFMTLLNVVDSQYYMFADQDDVWLEDKTAVTFQRIKEVEGQGSVNKPIVVHTDAIVVDENLNVKMTSKFNWRSISQSSLERYMSIMTTYDYLMITTVVQGCTMMFNRAAKEVSYSYLNLRVQDSNIALNVAKHSDGEIVTLFTPTMLYRIHSNNACGIKDNSLLSKFKAMRSLIRENMRGYYIWRLYGGGSFFKWLYYRLSYFYLYRFYK